MSETSAVPSAARRLSGFSVILTATMISGIASYVITWLVPRQIGLADYAVFAVFWSSIYLVVGALFGIQQEVTRGTHPADPTLPPNPSRARNFGIATGIVVFALVTGSAAAWVRQVFPIDGWSLVWPLAVGAASFVMVAVLGGSLYGVAEWRPLALMMVTDSVMRLVAISIVLLFTTNVVALAWAIAAPFPLTLILLWPFVRRSIIGRSQLDVGYRTLTWNVIRTIVAAASTGVMVSGFPLLLGVTSRSEPQEIVGLFVLTITLTRAPLIVVAMSLQSYFIVSFRDNAEHFWRQFLRIQALIFGAGFVLAPAGWLLGPEVFAFLFPGALRPERAFIAVLVLSSALVGALCVSAPAVLARSQHFVYSAGWVVAAAVTVIALLLPLDFTTRTLLALLSGPIAGLIIHSVYLVVAGRRERRVALTGSA
jgi:O-antigen/teichoic acid export membrane protein